MENLLNLTPEQEERCINEALYYIDVKHCPTVDEVLEGFKSYDEWYTEFFGANKTLAAERIVQLSKMDRYEFLERFHNVLENSTIVTDFYEEEE
jgi:hypothetical protein